MSEKSCLPEFDKLQEKSEKSKQKPETESIKETIEPPKDTYFIHGVKQWSKENRTGIRSPEISVSLQKDGSTKPLRPYGYILKIDKGAISMAFDRDVASQYNENYRKESKLQSTGLKRRQSSENELQKLIANTKIGSHNEIWVKGDKVEIVGAYITEEMPSSPGAKAFLKDCQKNNISVRIIKKESEAESG